MNAHPFPSPENTRTSGLEIVSTGEKLVRPRVALRQANKDLHLGHGVDERQRERLTALTHPVTAFGKELASNGVCLCHGYAHMATSTFCNPFTICYEPATKPTSCGGRADSNKMKYIYGLEDPSLQSVQGDPWEWVGELLTYIPASPRSRPDQLSFVVKRSYEPIRFRNESSQSIWARLRGLVTNSRAEKVGYDVEICVLLQSPEKDALIKTIIRAWATATGVEDSFVIRRPTLVMLDQLSSSRLRLPPVVAGSTQSHDSVGEATDVQGAVPLQPPEHFRPSTAPQQKAVDA